MTMRQTLHKSLTAHRPLHVSIVNEIPENSIRQSSQFITEQKGNELFYKISDQQHKYFKSLIVPRCNDNDPIIQSAISQTRFQYFKAIQKTLLLQNQNLKNHNEYLIKQIRQMFTKQRKLKKQSTAIQYQNDILKRILQEFQIRLGQFNEQMTKLMQKIQTNYINSLDKHLQSNFIHAANKQPYFTRDEQSYSISHSIQNMKRIFNRPQQSAETFDSLPKIKEYSLENIQKYNSTKKSVIFGANPNQQPCYSPRASKKINKLISTLQKIQLKMSNLCCFLSQESSTYNKLPSFRKQKTIQ